MPTAKSLYAPDEAQVDTAALAILMRSGVPLVVLDARAAEYFVDRRIPTARNLAPDSSASDAKSVIGSKNALIVTYCSNLHCPASTMLFRHLKELGYENVLEYHDGIAGWAAAGFPVETGA